MYSISKRLFDITLSASGIILLLPIMLIVGATIKITSPGPMIYRAKRIGFQGNLFIMFKFRSMELFSDRYASSTSITDKRVTNFGRFIRRFKIDEFPQLFNVFFGQMSIVGPRPELEKYTSLYNKNQKRILSVKPGMTDFSSIYFRNLNQMIGDIDPDKDFEERFLDKKNSLRLKYVSEMSFRTDLKIIIMTIIVIFKSKNAS